MKLNLVLSLSKDEAKAWRPLNNTLMLSLLIPSPSRDEA